MKHSAQPVPQQYRIVFHVLCLVALITQTLTPALTSAAPVLSTSLARLAALAAQHLPQLQAGTPAFVNVIVEPGVLPADGQATATAATT